MSRLSDERRMRGISLVEIVIALAILGMMATLSLGGLRLGVRTWETVGQRVETESHDQIVRAFLRRTLSQATPVLEAGADRQPRSLFAGDAESLTLIAPLAEYLALGGLQRLDLFVEDSGGDAGSRLVLVRVPYVPGGGDAGRENEEEAERHVLIEDAERIRFDYLRGGESGEREWTGSWTDEPTLPLAVRMMIEPGPGRLAPPDLIVPLRVTMVTGRL